ncbi:hypothetical protein [Albidovulum sediminis]|uniref:Uncharacterized protein n=1 Tax=Albidovulum sediminis TaxID=3066345 RepID=A0ABT2NJ51_9RHOB|nr:hypothetical protein [Defluviimonas sediminis]MCT8328937.1 hypothetical protein [Defluviimonas sediminis]
MTKDDWTGLFLFLAALAGLYGLHMADVGGWPGAIVTGVSGLILGYHVGKLKS